MAFAFCLTCGSSFAQGVIIHKSDSTTVKIFYDQLASISTYRTDSGVPDGAEAVDLGLSVKWANMNIGAYSESEIGGYYAWGETNEKSEYYWTNYEHCDGSLQTIHNIGDSISGTQYDVAHVKWGGHWRMPTYREMQEVLTKCTAVRGEVNGQFGEYIVGPNGNAIFLPAGGYRDGQEFVYTNRFGDYWGGTVYRSPENAYGFFFPHDEDYIGWDFTGAMRYDGKPVRAVWDDGTK